MFELTLCLAFDKQKYISQFYKTMVEKLFTDAEKFFANQDFDPSAKR